MARNCYVFAFLTIGSLLCVAALEEGGNALEKEEVKVVKEDQILRLPSEEESTTQEIPWEQSPIEIHSLRFPGRPMFGKEKEMEMEQQGRLRRVRFRFGRPGGCHGKFKQFLMPREDPSQLPFSPTMRMRMGPHHHHHHHHHAHAHPYVFPGMAEVGDDEKTSSTIIYPHLGPVREEMRSEKHREREFEGEREEEEEEERGAPWTAWLRSMFH